MFGELEEYRLKPIPLQGGALEARQGYRQWPIDRNHGCYHEGWANAVEHSIAGVNFYNRTDNPPYYRSIPGSIPQLYLRVGVIERLARMNERLGPLGLEVFVHDGWRPQVVQTYFHDVWFPDHLRTQHPDWSEARVQEEVSAYWARGFASEEEIDPNSPSPHSTGGAVDIGIRRKHSRQLLWMGTIFDDTSEKANLDYFEQTVHAGSSFSDVEALKNRRLLYWLANDMDFCVNPTEYWHISYGDQMWAKLITAELDIHHDAFYSAMRPGPLTV